MADDSQTQQNPLDLSQYITAQSEQANKSLGRSNDQYDWAKDQFAKNAATADKVQTRALDTGASFADYAKRDRNLYDTSYVPAMQQQLAYAQQYTTPERMAANRAQAIASGSLAANAVRAASERNLQSIGIDPSSGRYAGLEAGLDAKQAALNAGLATKSDRDTEMMGQQLLANAIKTGQVLPGQAVNQAGVSLAADKEAIDTGLATTASGAQTMGTPLQWQTLGSDTLKEWKNSMVAQTNAGMDNQRLAMEREKLAAGSSSGIGAAAGILGSLGGKAMSMYGGMGGGGGDIAGGSGTTFRRGGVVPQKPIKKFFAGGFSGFSGPDVRPISVGEGQQAFDPYDPGASLWGNLGEVDNPEFEDDETEAGLRGAGGTVGGMVGSIWGPIGQMAGREIGQKVGGGVGAAVQGHWGEAAQNLAEGTPFDMLFSERGGPVRKMRAGGAVRDVPEPEDIEEEDEARRNIEHRGYRPGREIDPQTGEKMAKPRAWREPAEEFTQDQPESDTNEAYDFSLSDEDYKAQRAEKRGKWVPNYAEGGAVDDDDEGEGGAEGGLTEEEMEELEELREMERSGQLNDRSVHEYAAGGTVGLRDTWRPNAYADGGDVEDPAMVDAEELAAASGNNGNMVPPEASPSRGAETDDVHAMLNEGEFVIPKQVVSWHGEKFFQNLIKKAYNEMQQPQVAEPELGPPQAMAISPPTFASQGG